MCKKYCPKCKLEKDLNEFEDEETTDDNKFYWCSYCVQEYKQYLEEYNKEKPQAPGMNYCIYCNTLKPLVEFDSNVKTKTDFKCVCKECSKEAVRKFNKHISELITKYYVEPVPDGFRRCYNCKEIKPLSEFGKKDACLCGINTKCKCCTLKINRLRKKGLSTRNIPKDEKYCPHCKQNKKKQEFKGISYGSVCSICEKERKQFLQNITRAEFHGFCVDDYLKDTQDKFSIAFERIENEISFIIFVRHQIKRKIAGERIKKFVLTQTCNCCGVEKPVEEYKQNKYSNTGYDKICRQCNSNKPKKKRDRTKEHKADSERMKTDSEYRIKKLVRLAIKHSFQKIDKKKELPTAKYGIDFTEIYKKIGNRPDSSFHLDHIIPLAAFDFNNLDHVRLSHLPENLRWLEKKENLKKQDKIIWSLISSNNVLLEISEQLKIKESYDGVDARKLKSEGLI